MGEAIELAGDGSAHSGYLASGEGAGPGLVVVADGWSLGAHAVGVCDRLAAEGFTALALDLTRVAAGGNGGSRPTAEAGDVARACGVLSRAVDWLVVHPAVRGHGVGVVGFGTGGPLALSLAALRTDQVRAVVPFYASAASGGARPDWGGLDAAVEAHVGETDPAAGPDPLASLQSTLESRATDVRVFTYPGVGDGFFDETRSDAYDEDAARQAWVRTLEFLRAKLG